MNWNDIEKELKEMKPESKPQDSKEFWDTFKAKASLVNQDGEEAFESNYNPGWARHAVILCSIILIIGLAAFYMNQDKSPVDEGKKFVEVPKDDQKETVQVKNEILELDIFASNDGCYISEEEDATFVYIFSEEDLSEEDGS